jgi:hypothetical protein
LVTFCDARFSSREPNGFVGIALDLAMTVRLEFKRLKGNASMEDFLKMVHYHLTRPMQSASAVNSD